VNFPLGLRAGLHPGALIQNVVSPYWQGITQRDGFFTATAGRQLLHKLCLAGKKHPCSSSFELCVSGMQVNCIERHQAEME